MAEEIRHSAGPHTATADNNSDNSELQQLRAFAKGLRDRADRLDAQLRHAEQLAARMGMNSHRNNGKQSRLFEGSGSSGSGASRRNGSG
jgi:hypothetical protein